MQTESEVKKILVKILGQSVDLENATRDITPEWDSIATLSILAELEEKFEVQLSNEEIQNLTNLTEIVKTIASK